MLCLISNATPKLLLTSNATHHDCGRRGGEEEEEENDNDVWIRAGWLPYAMRYYGCPS